MRKIALLALTVHVLILLSPISFAKITDEKVLEKDCSLRFGEDFNDNPELLNEWENLLGESFIDETDTCGEENPISKMMEIGDCTNIPKNSERDSLSVTEITEPIGPKFKISDTQKVVDVYTGICCLLYELDSENSERACTKSRTATFSESQNCLNNAAYCERRQWIIADSGIGVVQVFVKQAYIWGAGIVGFIAVTVIVVSGIQISVSGVSGDITQAKDRIIQSIAGLVLLFLSGLILYTINPTFFT